MKSVKILTDIEFVAPLRLLIAVGVHVTGLRAGLVHTNSVHADLAWVIGAVGVHVTGLRSGFALADLVLVAELARRAVGVACAFWRRRVVLAKLLRVAELLRRAVGIACAFWRRRAILTDTS